MKQTITFNACENLDFDQSKYTATLAFIGQGNCTKLTWERRFQDNLQLCQFCKLRGRLNNAEACLGPTKPYAEGCGDYRDFTHTVEVEVSE